MDTGGAVAPNGELGLSVLRGLDFPAPAQPVVAGVSVRDVARDGLPRLDLSDEVNAWRRRNVRHLWRGLRRISLARALRLPHFYGQLHLAVVRADGERVDLGLASLRVVTDTGVGFIVDAFQNSVELENMKFHGLGTGSTAENQTDTALVTELTTEYTGNVRATGTTTEAAANIYQTVATNTMDAAPGAAIREHGVLSQAATGGGVLLDRTVFAAITLANGDGIQSDYRLTFTAGS